MFLQLFKLLVEWYNYKKKLQILVFWLPLRYMSHIINAQIFQLKKLAWWPHLVATLALYRASPIEPRLMEENHGVGEIDGRC